MTAAPAEGLKHFNSIKVQLELIIDFSLRRKEPYFNSIKVQLELITTIRYPPI